MGARGVGFRRANPRHEKRRARRGKPRRGERDAHGGGIRRAECGTCKHQDLRNP